MQFVVELSVNIFRNESLNVGGIIYTLCHGLCYKSERRESSRRRELVAWRNMQMKPSNADLQTAEMSRRFLYHNLLQLNAEKEGKSIKHYAVFIIHKRYLSLPSPQ